ncbi:hypothetical protein P153DRAFT_147090 [Dothidotthia symphoricarpi CBS 119687]|uniref:Uncharacterized protein n=1 Tax=Dothidotthia symphoricarpi CBS 119687 TaxID=1392245 RepID=A0A6A5ZZR3_9PLEO|nr:uncharacterized protein P153DRAFT_147090 [Dothidotthia symphoricarpi CBS 119687]KAF2123821.1 hypothetical protein P153DRAFT_147090 [Dothidotthia symphoricarpi CBS 119687]
MAGQDAHDTHHGGHGRGRLSSVLVPFAGGALTIIHAAAVLLAHHDTAAAASCMLPRPILPGALIACSTLHVLASLEKWPPQSHELFHHHRCRTIHVGFDANCPRFGSIAPRKIQPRLQQPSFALRYAVPT